MFKLDDDHIIIPLLMPDCGSPEHAAEVAEERLEQYLDCRHETDGWTKLMLEPHEAPAVYDRMLKHLGLFIHPEAKLLDKVLVLVDIEDQQFFLRIIC